MNFYRNDADGGVFEYNLTLPSPKERVIQTADLSQTLSVGEGLTAKYMLSPEAKVKF